ncbi:reverse transcriptase domain-containing protein [Chloroflexota bacterium]
MYRLLYNKDLYLTAYGKLYANKGALTKGIDANDTIQGMNLERIDKIINQLKSGTYQWTSVRRVNIPKKKDKTRPIGILVWSDKLLQEVIRMVLEAYYNPQFSDLSHGYRPQRGCHTALQEISKWHGTKWYIEADLEKCFDKIDHNQLLTIMGHKIKDQRVLKLVAGLLKAGYIENWEYHTTYSGTPQGSGLSPLMANVILNELDQYVENELIPQYTKGQKRKWNSEYRRLGSALANAKKKGNVEQYKQLYQQRRQLPTMNTQDPDFRRLRYVRYADDILLGFIGPRSEAVEIKNKLSQFLQNIKLTLSEEKTLITHANIQRAKFLGYEIHIAKDNNQYDGKKTRSQAKRRSINGRPIFRVPKDVIKAWCKRDTRKGGIIHRPALLECSDYEITKTYAMELQGLVNYYQYAHNVSHLYTVKYHLMTSLAKTIAAKHKRSTTWVYKKYKKKSEEGMTAIIVEIPNPNNPEKPLCTQFGNKPIRQNRKVVIQDEIVQFQPGRNELVRRLLANECELCGSHDNIRVHHIRQVKDIRKKYKGRPNPPKWARFMMERNRKTVVVCHQCHTTIHAGKYSGKKVE